MADDKTPEGPVDELPEGAEMVPDEIQQEIKKKERDVLERILDRAASDDKFKNQLLDNPEKALQDLGVSQELEALDNPGQMAEVAGQARYHTKYVYRCRRYSYRYKLYHWSY